MRRDFQDKQAATVEAVEACPVCGQPRTEWGCRRVPLGDWCLSNGLRQDPRTVIGPPPDPLKAAVEADRQVKAAAAELERLQAQAERFTSEWEIAALAEFQAKQRRYAGSQEVSVGGTLATWTSPGTPSLGSIAQLAEAAAEADARRRHAAEKVISGRQALEVARARARARLLQTAAS